MINRGQTMSKREVKMKNTSVVLPADVKKSLRFEAVEGDESLSDVIRRVLCEHVKNRNRQKQPA